MFLKNKAYVLVTDNFLKLCGHKTNNNLGENFSPHSNCSATCRLAATFDETEINSETNCTSNM
jgi:hypothetical protein